MKKNSKTWILFILIPLVTGAVSGFLTRGGMENFGSMNKPPLSPPLFLFPVVWTLLYILMGISSYLVYQGAGEKRGRKDMRGNNGNTEVGSALSLYAYQLTVNFLWPVFFFQFQWYFFSFLWLVLLWVLTAVMILKFGKISLTAAWLNVPYLLWLSFAGYLNLGIWLLN